VQRYLRYFPIAVIPLAAMMLWGDGVFFGTITNRVGIAYFVCYICLVLWIAFALPYVRLSFDLSYGCYVWHMPIINLLLVLVIPSMPLAVILTFSIAALSWFLVEKPALKLKRQSLKAA
jgi:peptidoglycan/LPS O-acetylase OafA/YrhL